MTAAKARLQKQIEKEQQKQQLRVAAAGVDVDAIKADLQKDLQKQADAFVQQQLAQREQQLQQQFHDAWEQRMKGAEMSEDQQTRFQYSSAKKLVFAPEPSMISNRSDIGDDF